MSDEGPYYKAIAADLSKHTELGNIVLVANNHWLRPGERGVIVEIAHNKRGLRYCVKFDDKWDGGGIDGDKLWLEDDRFSKV